MFLFRFFRGFPCYRHRETFCFLHSDQGSCQGAAPVSLGESVWSLPRRTFDFFPYCVTETNLLLDPVILDVLFWSESSVFCGKNVVIA